MRAIVTALSLALTMSAVTMSAASAQEFPSRPIRLVAPFSAGGPTDFAARLFAEHFQQKIGQPIVVENRPGASGVPGTEAAMASDPDGYTLVVGGIAPIALVPAVKKLRYDVEKDMAPLGLIWRSPQVLAVRATLDVKTVKDLVAYANKNPGKVSVGSAGVGTVTHLAGLLFEQEAALKLIHVPYRSTSNSVTDLVGGQIDMIFGNDVILLPHIKSGAVKALAITSKDRSTLLPELPTMEEAGFPKVQTEVWFGVFASSRIPAPVLKKLEAAVEETQRDPQYRAALLKRGVVINAIGAKALGAFVTEESQRWAPILRATGVKF